MDRPFSTWTGARTAGFVFAAVACPDPEPKHRSGPLWWAYSLLSAAGAALAITIVAGLFLWWWTRRSAQQDSRPDDRYRRHIGLLPRAQIRLPAKGDISEPTSQVIPASSIDKPAAAPEPEPPPCDDLRRIRGIGPKTANLLQSVGILTYAQIAMTDVDELHEILTHAGMSPIVDPTTWPEQARLAAEDDWAALEALQEELKARR